MKLTLASFVTVNNTATSIKHTTAHTNKTQDLLQHSRDIEWSGWNDGKGKLH